MTSPSRRDFLKTSTVAALAATLPNAHAAGGDVLRVGLVGCGGRGTGAATQALAADQNVKLTAMADAFEDRLDQSLAVLRDEKDISSKIDVPTERRFVGFDACAKLLASGVNVALLCTPPHFRPQHLRLAIEAGVHVFAEKPTAVERARSSFGLEDLRTRQAKETVDRLRSLSATRLRFSRDRQTDSRRSGRRDHRHSSQRLSERAWSKPKRPDWTEMYYQMRNWYNFTWLSGDFNVEQHVHILDLSAWAFKDRYPVKAIGMGGRQILSGPEYGQIYDHFSVVYEYEDGAKIFGNCRQQPGCANDISAQVMGSLGKADLSERRGGLRIRGKERWQYDGPSNNMYQTEHDALFAGIRRGEPINDGESMAKSSLLAIMGRMAAYTGQIITWDMALNSTEDLSPSRYDWDAAPPASSVAEPGRTRFV